MVFSNFLPNTSKLSKDRWKIYDVECWRPKESAGAGNTDAPAQKEKEKIFDDEKLIGVLNIFD